MLAGLEISLQALFFLLTISMASGLRVLCLHGSGSSGTGFREALQGFVDHVQSRHNGVQFVFPTAPHKKDATGHAWWLMEAGERSYNAKKLQGLQESVGLVEGLYPCDVIVGHSQGAMLASILLARQASQWIHASTEASLIRGGILTGAAWPATCSELFESSHSVYRSSGRGPLTLHAIGQQDTVNPPEMAAELAEVFRFSSDSVTILQHSGGHIFPQDMNSLEQYTALIRRTLER